MRYYDITITNAKTGALVRPASLAQAKLNSTFTSFVNGKTLPGALNVEINCPVFNYANPISGAFIRIWGISLQEIAQATDLAGANIIVRAGMQKGLPLANPKQAGVLVQGTIFQSIGNWVNTDMTLDLMILPPAGQNQTAPKNFVFNWKANTPLADALKTTFQVAMPGFTTQIAISDKLKYTSDKPGIYGDIVSFSQMIKNLTTAPQFLGIKTKSGAVYAGVNITISNNSIVATDGTKDTKGSSADNPKKIAFVDLIGQPTWYSPQQINFKTVMRADVAVGDYVSMPNSNVVTQQGASLPGTPARNKAAFQGKFVITSVFHFGNYRQADAASWVTSYNAVFASNNDLATKPKPAAP